MDTALVVITLLSVGLTAALLVYAARLQREQREREQARVHALAREIRGEPDTVGSGDGPRFFGDGDTGGNPHFPGGPTGLLMFAGDVAPEAGPRRYVIPLIGAGIVSAALGGLYLLNARPAAATAPVVSTNLELLELHHARAGDRLTVSGVVRNPRGAAPRDGVSVVVFVFDQSGTFVTSGRAPIDFQKLEASGESPFTVIVPNARTVARYRVSFRTERDVLPHLDRRVSPGASLKDTKAQGPKGTSGTTG